MKINHFIHMTINQIQEAVKDFNKHSLEIKASMPKTIQFELAIHETRYGVEVLEYDSPAPKEISRVSITIDMGKINEY